MPCFDFVKCSTQGCFSSYYGRGEKVNKVGELPKICKLFFALSRTPVCRLGSELVCVLKIVESCFSRSPVPCQWSGTMSIQVQDKGS